MSDHGAIELPDGQQIPWVRRRVTLEEIVTRWAALEGRSVRVVMSHVEHGERLLTEYVVPHLWLNTFLTEWLDEFGTGTEEILSVEPVPTVTVEGDPPDRWSRA